MHYWEYFLAIEDDLAKTSRFVEFVKDNYKTFSIEFARIILASSSEFDVVAKEICKSISPQTNVKNINDYRNIILSKFPKYPSMEVIIPRFNIILNPWGEWKESKNTSWWKSYNNVKHNRDEYYNEATLEVALNSVAGLMCGILYYFRITLGDRVPLEPSPKLFKSKYILNYSFPSLKLDFNLPDDFPY